MTAAGASRVIDCLDEEAAQRIVRLETFERIDSTNTYLMENAAPPAGRWHVAIADEQTGGRGRGGNPWRSKRGGGLWMSAAYTFEAAPAGLSSLTLAVGAVVAAELEALGLERIRLKWPNDLVVGQRKLGGILVESTARGRTAVCGIGINLDTPRLDDDKTSLAPIGLKALMATPPDRDSLAALMLEGIVQAAPLFAAEGFAAFRSRWTGYDWLLGQAVTVTGIDPELSGIASGIFDDGALRVRDGAAEHRVVSGTVRPSGRGSQP